MARTAEQETGCGHLQRLGPGVEHDLAAVAAQRLAFGVKGERDFPTNYVIEHRAYWNVQSEIVRTAWYHVSRHRLKPHNSRNPPTPPGTPKLYHRARQKLKRVRVPVPEARLRGRRARARRAARWTSTSSSTSPIRKLHADAQQPRRAQAPVHHRDPVARRRAHPRKAAPPSRGRAAPAMAADARREPRAARALFAAADGFTSAPPATHRAPNAAAA